MQDDARDIAYIQERLRYDRAGRSLGVNKSTRAVYWALLVTGEAWTIASLAQITGRGRSTVQRITASGVRRGLMAEKDHKISLTPKGREVVLWLHRETHEIALGIRRGYSLEMIEFFKKFGPGQVKKEAANISFKPLNEKKQ